MTQNFSKKRIDLTITLGAGEFGESVGDTVTLTGLRMTADVLKPMGDTMGTLNLRVYGLPQDAMNELTRIGMPNQIKPLNTIMVAAGDEINGMKTVFQGVIWQAWADYAGAPDVAFNLIAQVGIDLAMRPVGAVSYKGAASVVDIMRDLAEKSGLAFDHYGVTAQLSNPYFPGSTLDQIRACARAADINFHIDFGRLSIWPAGASRAGEVATISPETGMVGYPAMSSQGLTIRSIFNPSTSILTGATINVRSSLPAATGEFNVFDVSHSLSSETPNGPWFSIIQCYPNVK